MTLEEKLAAFDAEAVQAYNSILASLGHRMAAIISLARERHVWGHETYGDGLLFELTAAELADERDQELADAVVYEMVRQRGGARCSRA